MNLLDLAAKITLDAADYKKGLDDAEKDASSFGEKTKKVFGATMKAVGAAVTGASTALVKLTKDSLDAYADFEQLTGGVETLFGSSEKTITKYTESVSKSYVDFSTVGADTWDKMGKSVSGFVGFTLDAADATDYMFRAVEYGVGTSNENFEAFAAEMANLKGWSTDMSQQYWNGAEKAVAANKLVEESVTETANKTKIVTEDASGIVMANANKAYETAGLSANAYMETVTSFSSALLKSLDYDTVKSAEVADMAIIDMADNANKMGTDIEAIQNAYQGFAKENYTMLDNLKLGYGGTKQGMEELLKDAEAISGVHYEVGNFADMAEAIHIIQTEMGITGTTAKEANETISGSLNMLKGAWTNLVTGLADENADIGQLVDNVVGSFATVIANIAPRIETILPNISKALSKIIDALIPIVINLVESMLPDLLDSALKLVDGIVKALPELIGVITDALPTVLTTLLENSGELIEAALQIVETLIQFVADNIDTIVAAVVGLVEQIAGFIGNYPAEFITLALALISAVADALMNNLPALLGAIMDIVIGVIDGLIDNLPTILETLFLTVIQLVLGAIDLLFSEDGILATLLTKIGELLGTIIETLVGWGENLWSFITEVIVPFLDNIWDRVTEWTNNIVQKVVEFFGNIKAKVDEWKSNAIQKIVDFIKDIRERLEKTRNNLQEKIEKFKEYISEIPDKIKGFFENLPENLKSIGKDIVDGLKNGISEKWDSFVNFVTGGVDSFVQGIKDKLGIHSPSRVFKDQIGANMALGLGEGFVDTMDDVSSQMQNALPDYYPKNYTRTKTSTASSIGSRYDAEPSFTRNDADQLTTYSKAATETDKVVADFIRDFDGEWHNYWESVDSILHLLASGQARSSVNLENIRELVNAMEILRRA